MDGEEGGGVDADTELVGAALLLGGDRGGTDTRDDVPAPVCELAGEINGLGAVAERDEAAVAVFPPVAEGAVMDALAVEVDETGDVGEVVNEAGCEEDFARADRRSGLDRDDVLGCGSFDGGDSIAADAGAEAARLPTRDRSESSRGLTVAGEEAVERAG
jgi:hypothetical protein